MSASSARREVARPSSIARENTDEETQCNSLDFVRAGADVEGAALSAPGVAGLGEIVPNRVSCHRPAPGGDGAPPSTETPSTGAVFLVLLRVLSLQTSAQRDVAPAASSALDLHLLGLAPAHPDRAVLRVYELAGEVLSLGRYHVAPAGDQDGRVRLHRRLGGGRVLPLGAGFVLVSLTLPHRSALVAADPGALRPEQVLNRCVRGLLGAVRRLGVDAFYPGRDRITVDGRMLGVVSIETDVAGATVFEAALAADADWLEVADRVATVDPGGVIAAEVLAPSQVTTLARHGAVPTLDDFADGLATSYAQQFGLTAATGTELTTPSEIEARASTWLASRRLRPGLSRHAIEWGQLGVFEVYLEAPAGTIEAVLLAGDFIANSASVELLEHRLRGCPLVRDAVARAVDDVYADPDSYLLGIAPAQVVDTILRAA